jgi:hypothetical protein
MPPDLDVIIIFKVGKVQVAIPTPSLIYKPDLLAKLVD